MNGPILFQGKRPKFIFGDAMQQGWFGSGSTVLGAKYIPTNSDRTVWDQALYTLRL